MVSFFLKAVTIFIIALGIYIAVTIKDIPSEYRDGIFLMYVAGVLPLLICNIFAEIDDEKRALHRM